MAEAVVEGTSTSRFFCHKCCVEIEDLLPDYTCPRCTGGFVEELQNGGGGGGSGGGGGVQNSTGDNNLGPDFVTGDNTFDYYISTLSNYLTDDVNLLGVSNHGDQTMDRNRQNFRHFHRSRLARRRQDNPIRVFMQDFLEVLEANLVTQDGQPSLLFFANPQDSIRGQAGFDAVVTHMLNQLDGTAGPPPLPRKQIDKIPTTTVTQSQVDSKMQCSVCWENFKLSEPVRELPCHHLYHAPCILPWLELHGTCPICRQNLRDENATEANQEPTVEQLVAAHFRAMNGTNDNRASNSNNSSSSSSSESTD